MTAMIRQSVGHPPMRHLPANVVLADFFASSIADDVGSVSCDARALHAMLLNVSGSDVALSRLLSNAMADYVPGANLEIWADLEDGGFLLSGVQHPEPTVRCILARERIPFAGIRDDTTLRTLRWLLARLEEQKRDDHPFIKTELIGEAAKLPSVPLHGPMQTGTAADGAAPAVRVLMQAKTREGRASLPRILPLACAEVCPLMSDADIIMLDVASVDFRATKSWSALLRLNPVNELARIVVVADQPCYLHIENAHLVDWDTRVADFRQILLEIAGKAPLARTLPPPQLESADEAKYSALIRGIETQVSQRASRRANRIQQLADEMLLPVDEAWAAVRKSEADRLAELPRIVAIAIEELQRYEVTTERIAFQTLGWTDDHLRRWLRERSLPSFKELITQAQVEHANRVLTRSDLDWPSLIEELGMTQKYVKRWSREHGLHLPSSLDENTRLSRVKDRLRRRQA